VTDDERNSVAHVSLEPTRATIKSIDDDGAVCPGYHIFNGYTQSTPDVAEQFRQQVSSTKLKSWDGQTFDGSNSGL